MEAVFESFVAQTLPTSYHLTSKFYLKQQFILW